MKTPLANRWARRKEKLSRSLDKVLFNLFMHPDITKLHAQILGEADSALADKVVYENDEACLSSLDPVVRQGWELKREVERHFQGRYSGHTTERILIQVPAEGFSPAGYSLFTNLAESLQFIGVPTRILEWDADIRSVLMEFQPTILLSSDHVAYLTRVDWEAVANYKASQRLRVGLTASLEEYGNAPIQGRLDWARQHGVDFFYTFRDEDYVRQRAEYRPFFAAQYPMLYLPFGANVLHYYPVAGFSRDLDFVIMATRKREHMSYMKTIARNHSGLIDGPGWKHVHGFHFNRDRDRYIYARAKVGLNVHLREQIEWACEVNERTYQLAVCGVPQLVDHPLLIDKLFARDTLYVADTPAQYARLFREIMDRPEESVQRALGAQKEAFARHTTFHRADAFVRQLTGV